MDRWSDLRSGFLFLVNMYVPENHNHSDPKPLDFGASSSRKFGFSTSSVNFFFYSYGSYNLVVRIVFTVNSFLKFCVLGGELC